MFHLKHISGIEKGDPAAIETAVLAYYDEIYRFVYRKVGNQADAQDITQEVFLKFVSNIKRYRECGKLKSYLFKLAINATTDYFRNKHDSFPLRDLDEISVSSKSILDNLVMKEDIQLIYKALNALPEFQSNVIILRFYHNLSFHDIAKITDCSVSTAKSRYRQGIEKIKKSIRGDICEK